MYGYLKVHTNSSFNGSGSEQPIDVFTDGEPEANIAPSVLSRRSYIDDTG